MNLELTERNQWGGWSQGENANYHMIVLLQATFKTISAQLFVSYDVVCDTLIGYRWQYRDCHLLFTSTVTLNPSHHKIAMCNVDMSLAVLG